MSEPENRQSDLVERLKQRFLPQIQVRMEGSINQNSPDDVQMFDDLLNELLDAESIVISRNERLRLRQALLKAF